MAKPDYVFISYAREDLEAAQQVCEDLENAGIEVWFDQRSLLPGQRWRTEIRRAINDCSYFVALLSSNSVSKRGYVQKELKEALGVLDELPPAETFIIPVRLDECNPSHESLSELHWVDLFPSRSEGVQRVLRAIGKVAETPTHLERITPTGDIQEIWVDYDVSESGSDGNDDEIGMEIHVRFSVQHLKGRNARAVAFFFFEDGASLEDFNDSYNSTDGKVSTGEDFNPDYDDTYYDDLTLYIPYDELHLVDGRHNLKFYVGLYVKDTNKYFATSDWEYFWVKMGDG